MSSRPYPNRSKRTLFSRPLSLILTLSLLLPFIAIALPDRSRASGISPAKAVRTAVRSLPPEHFDFGNGRGWQATASSLSSRLQDASTAVLAFSSNLIAPATEISDLDAETEEPQAPLPQPTSVVDFDFDGDGKADIGRWNAPTTNFRVKNSSSGSITNHTIGSTSAVSAPGRFDA